MQRSRSKREGNREQNDRSKLFLRQKAQLEDAAPGALAVPTELN